MRRSWETESSTPRSASRASVSCSDISLKAPASSSISSAPPRGTGSGRPPAASSPAAAPSRRSGRVIRRASTAATSAATSAATPLAISSAAR